MCFVADHTGQASARFRSRLVEATLRLTQLTVVRSILSMHFMMAGDSKSEDQQLSFVCSPPIIVKQGTRDTSMIRIALLMTGFLVVALVNAANAQSPDPAEELRLLRAENVMLVKSLAQQREDNAKQAEQIKQLQNACARAGITAAVPTSAPSTQPDNDQKCSTCQGVKIVACTACRYASQYPTGLSRCAKCRGERKIACPDCKGAWGHACSYCNGTGRVKSGQRQETNMIVSDAFRNCSQCNGAKDVYQCRVVNTGATGQCARAKSKGKVPCPDCRESGMSGPCQTCRGEKRIACPKCQEPATTQPAGR